MHPRNVRLSAVVSSLILLASPWAKAVGLFDVETFQDTTVHGWTNGRGGNTITLASGGAGGALDTFLRIPSGSSGGNPPKLASYNFEPRYIGDYLAIGATHVRADMKHLGGPQLSMRLVLMDDFGGEWTSTVPVVIPAGTGWTTYNFPMGPSNLTQVQGMMPYADGIATVNRIMFRHQVGSPSSSGSSVTAVLGIDNIQIVGPSQTLSGQLVLADTGTFGAGLLRSISYSVVQGTQTIGSGTILATSSLTNFSINVGASFTGAATIQWDGSSFLKKNTAITLTGSAQSTGSVVMVNGDADGSGEVDAADIDNVIANFGQTWPGGPGNIHADVDASGEVDAADIDITISNFGAVDE